MPWLRRRLVNFFSANTDVLHRSLLLAVIFIYVEIELVAQAGACQVSSVGRVHYSYLGGHMLYLLLSCVCA